MNHKATKLVILIGLCIVIATMLMQRMCSGPLWSRDPELKPGSTSSQQASSSHARITAGDQAFLDAFNRRLDLFGKVVDQHGKPIEGATIEVYANNKPFSDGGPPDVTLVSDVSGAFSVVGLNGIALGVLAMKKGYIHYSPLGGPTSSANITSSKHSDAAHPLILTLHDPGELEPLVHTDEQRWGFRPDGTPRKIALDSKDGRSGSHMIEFKFITKRFSLPEDQLYSSQYDWSFEATIPGGGFVRNKNDLEMEKIYQFEAPTGGYQESIHYEFPSTLPKEQWKKMEMDSFFIRFPDDTYGRIRFRIDGFSDRSPLTMETWFNPKPGSRNLSSLYK